MKFFTLAEANDLIPPVRSVLLKIQARHKYISSLRTAAQAAANSAQFGGGGMQSGALYVKSLYELGKLTLEIDALGIQLKDYSRGLIDFPAMRGNRIILLCWQLGEGDEVKWWHDLETGFAGRKPL
ncbi:MAG: DUF2203 domain-containing protein [Pyrinomonadaceae bacterium]